MARQVHPFTLCGALVHETIPALLVTAAERDPVGEWLRTDGGTLTFGAAAGLVARVAERLHDSGVRRGDLVVVTARTTPPYLLCWLALAALGAVSVPTDPASTPHELAGLVGQVRPTMLISDADCSPRSGVSRPLPLACWTSRSSSATGSPATVPISRPSPEASDLTTSPC